MKRFFLINPTARNGKSRRRLARVCRDLRERLGAFDHAVTTSGADAESQTRRALQKGAEQIVVFGGDGTVNASINGFFESGVAVRPDARLVVSRCGTGSDYYRSIAPGRDWTKQIEHHRARAVDVGRIDFLDRPGGTHRHFLNLTSVGLSALAVRGKLAPPVPAALSYLVPGIRALFTWRAPRVRITSERLDAECELLNLFVAKGRFAGGGLKLGGLVSLDDGHFDLTVVEKMSLFAALPRALRLLGKGLREERHVHRHVTKWVEVQSPEPLPLEADGEPMESAAVRLTLLPSAVNVCFPLDTLYT